MLILAFETSAKAGSVALLEGSKLLGESYQNTGLTHSQTIMAMAQDMIAACDYTVRIPMSHGVDSLNVAAASAVAFFQLGNH